MYTESNIEEIIKKLQVIGKMKGIVQALDGTFVSYQWI